MINKKTLIITLMAACLSCAETLNAAGSESRSFLSSSRLGSSLEDASNSTVVLDKEIIQSSGSRNIADILRLVPGFFVGYKYGNQASIGYSMHPDELTKRIQVLLDGRTLYLNTTGGVMYQNLPVQLEDIEKIEVVRGASSSTNGPNSMLATVHIYTAHASERQGSEIITRHGNNDIEDYYVQHSNSVGDMYFTTSLNHHSDSGLENRYDSREDTAGWARFDYLLNESNEFALQLGYTDSKYGSGGSDPLLDPKRSIYQYHKFANFNWKNTSAKGDDFKLKASFTEFENDHKWSSAAPISPFGFVHFNIDYNFISSKIELEKTLTFSEELKLVMAAGHHKDKTKAPGSLFPNEGEYFHSETSQVYALSEYQPSEKWLLTAGFMAEKSTLSENDIEFSPQFTGKYELSDNQSLRAGYSKGARTPVSYDVYGSRVVFTDAGVNLHRSYPSYDIKSETAETFDLSYMYSSKLSRFETRIYETTTRNLIGKKIIPTPPGVISLTGPVLFSFDNFDGQTTATGIEFYTDTRLTPKLRLVGSLSLNDVDSSVQENPETPNQETAAPKKTAAILLSYQASEGLTLSTMYSHADEVVWQGEGSDSVNKLDIKAEKCWTGSEYSRFCLSLTGNHVTEKTHDYFNDRYFDSQFFVEFKLVL